MQELPISIIPYISSCFYDYFVIWKNISINHELFLELGAVLTVFDSLCHHVWGLRLLYPGDLVTFLDQHVRVSTVCYLWKTRVSLFSLTKNYQSNSVPHIFLQFIYIKFYRENLAQKLKILFFETLQLQHCKPTYICNIISLFTTDNTCIFQSDLYLQSSLFLRKQLTLKENFGHWFRK